MPHWTARLHLTTWIAWGAASGCKQTSRPGGATPALTVPSARVGRSGAAEGATIRQCSCEWCAFTATVETARSARVGLTGRGSARQFDCKWHACTPPPPPPPPGQGSRGGADNDTCGIQAHAGRPHRLSRPTPQPLGQSVICLWRLSGSALRGRATGPQSNPMVQRPLASSPEFLLGQPASQQASNP